MNILEELFYGNLDPSSIKYGQKIEPEKDKELQAYHKLKKLLNEDGNETLEEFINLLTTREGEYHVKQFIYGFKIGLLIGLECSKLDDDK